MSNLDRSEISRALAKALAFKQCGKHYRASQWAARLVQLLDAADILTTEGTSGARVAELEG